MILSDRSIREAIASGRLGIEPFDPTLIQPSSIDVRLDNKFLVFRNTKRAYIDVKQPADDLMELIEVGPDEPMFLHPHEFVLGSTIERVRVPDDLVGRLEGRSSLGRLGIVIHSSLPYDEPVLFLDRGGQLAWRPIGELVEQRVRGRVVGFDRDTFEVGYFEVTNWFRELPDKIYEVRLASGRTIRVTAGHNLFTLDSAGHLVKTPTCALRPGSRVAIPRQIPDPSLKTPELRLLDLLPAHLRQDLVCEGPVVDLALARQAELRVLLTRAGRLPLAVLERVFDDAPVPIGSRERLAFPSSPHTLPAILPVDADLAWLLGLYVADGHRRHQQVVFSNPDRAILDRVEAVLRRLEQPVSCGPGAIACCSALLSAVFDALGIGGRAPAKRLPLASLGWPSPLLEALLRGLLDGHGWVRPEREGLWTTSAGLVADVLLIAARLGRRASAQVRAARTPRHLPLHAVSLCSVPVPSNLAVDARTRPGTAVHQLEHARVGQSVGVMTLDRVVDTAATVVNDLLWDEVVEVVDTRRFEPVYDLEVRSHSANVENFVAGYGGVFAANTAGFIDASFDGHITLEISNLANLPIALYPGMRIGQISFVQMTTPAELPYGPARGSKYSGQELPTASRLYLDFRGRQQT